MSPHAVPDRPSAVERHRERFLVIKLADLGDVLTATPALRALRATYPTARIDALVTPVGATILEGLDSVNDCLVFEKARFDRLRPTPGAIAAALALGSRLRRAHYDRVFLLHHLFTAVGRLKYAALLEATDAPWRAGLAERCPAFLSTSCHDGGYGVRHEADYWLDVVGLAGAVNPAPRLEVHIDAGAHARAVRLLETTSGPAGHPRIALYPGTGPYSLARRWPVERYGVLARRLVEQTGAEILVVGGDAERGLAEFVASAGGDRCHNLAGQTDLKSLAAVLSRCDLFIGNDGGVMHLAVAAGAPVVGIFGPSNAGSWGPYPGRHGQDRQVPRPVVLRADLPCAPCQYRGYLPGTRLGCPARDCLRAISVEQVVQAALNLFDLS